MQVGPLKKPIEKAQEAGKAYAIDAQPALNIFHRGDTIIITGYVDNDAGFDADGVEVHLLVDGGATTETDFTDGGCS